MTRRQRLRRVAILCLHCIRNIAFYKAGWRDTVPGFYGPFWVNANGNFMDVSVLEWCKLYGDPRGGHYWRKVVTEPTNFFSGLLTHAGITEAHFEGYVNEMRAYRDKFLAHLDSELVMHIPVLAPAQLTASYLYEYLRAHEDQGSFFLDGPSSASEYYARCFREARAVYESAGSQEQRARLEFLS